MQDGHLQKDEPIEYLKQQSEEDEVNQAGKDTEEEKIKLRDYSSMDQDQSCKMDLFLAKVASLEIQLKEQRDLLNDKDEQINAQAETIRKQESQLKQQQDTIREKQDQISVLEGKNTQLESYHLRMEIVVKKSNRLQEEYFDEIIKLREQTQEQASLLDEKEDQLNGQSLKMKYLSDLCCQAQEAMHEDKATIAGLKYDIQDLKTSLEEHKEDLEECKQSLFTTNQIIKLTEQRDSHLKSYVRRLASYYQNKEEQRGSCFPLKMLGYKRQQSPAANIVNKLAQVLLSEEQN